MSASIVIGSASGERADIRERRGATRSTPSSLWNKEFFLYHYIVHSAKWNIPCSHSKHETNCFHVSMHNNHAARPPDAVIRTYFYWRPLPDWNSRISQGFMHNKNPIFPLYQNTIVIRLSKRENASFSHCSHYIFFFTQVPPSNCKFLKFLDFMHSRKPNIRMSQYAMLMHIQSTPFGAALVFLLSKAFGYHCNLQISHTFMHNKKPRIP